MKKLFTTVALLFPLLAFGQSGNVLHLMAGSGMSSAEWVPATDAYVGPGSDLLCTDNIGNLYFQDALTIRKVDASSGLIHTVAGIGTVAYSGDGGAATAAAIEVVRGVTTDNARNLYITSDYHVRKVDASSGIITTVVTAYVKGAVVFDESGNMYFIGALTSYNGGAFIKKVDVLTGVTSLFAGSDTSSLSGIDGAPATACSFSDITHMSFDPFGNLYLEDSGRIRKIDATTGIITTVTGSRDLLSSCGGFAIDATGNIITMGCNRIKKIDVYTGQITTVDTSGPAEPISGQPITGHYAFPWSGQYDNHNNLVFSDGNRIWKISSPDPSYAADSFTIYATSDCVNTRFTLSTSHYHPAMSFTTYYGDGTSSSNTVVNTGGSIGACGFVHNYSTSGNYIVKNILFVGSAAVDSVSYSYHFAFCNYLSTRFYFDANSNCSYDLGIDQDISSPVRSEIAINGVPIDTISATSGFNYKAYGSYGDVVSIRVISLPPGLAASCPATSIVYDTLQVTTLVQPNNKIAFNCTATPGFDLEQFTTARAGMHAFEADIIVDNTYCNPQAGTLTVNMSPKYDFVSASPAPSSVSGHTVTWNLAGLFSGEASRYIHASFEKPATTPSYLPGDTLISDYNIDPTTGDAIPSSNYSVRIDTVKSGFDPNYITVTPEGYIPSGTLLQYGIGFENTGNDTAYNIVVIDTLSEYLNMHSFRMLAASATMNVSMEPYGEKTIVKFDFPNINLQDSTHHDQCNGMLMYNIKVKDNLIPGTIIPNRAGIYFDTNPVVMTNTATNIIGWPAGIATLSADNKMELYPNPATNQLTIKTLHGDYSSLAIMSSVGNTVMQHEITGISTSIDVASLPAGIYYITLKGTGGVTVGRFVKL